MYTGDGAKGLGGERIRAGRATDAQIDAARVERLERPIPLLVADAVGELGEVLGACEDVARP